MAGVQTFTVKCDPGLAERLAAAVMAAAAVDRQWVTTRRAALLAEAKAGKWPTGRVSQARRELALEHAALRAAGELRGTRGLLILPALVAQLDARGWTGRRWRRVPEAARRGRPWGAGDQELRAKVVVQLPDDVAEVVVRGCYWTSLPYVRRLQAFYDEHGDHWRGERHDGRLGRHDRAGNPVSGPTVEQLAGKSRVLARIVTTGMVLRQAITDTVGDPAPEPAEKPPGSDSPARR